MAMFIMMFVIWWLSFAPPAGEAVTLDEAARIERAEELTGEGWSLWQQQKLAEAISKFEQATALDPQAPNAWNGLGWASFNSGRTEQGIAAFEKAVELEPEAFGCGDGCRDAVGVVHRARFGHVRVHAPGTPGRQAHTGRSSRAGLAGALPWRYRWSRPASAARTACR